MMHQLLRPLRTARHAIVSQLTAASPVGAIAGVVLLLSACTGLVEGPGKSTPDTDDGGETPTQVADVEPLIVSSPEITATDLNSDGRPVWVHELSAAGASYIAPHFQSANLPDGAKLVIRSVDNSRVWAYTKTDIDRKLAVSEGFWGIHVWGTRAVVELYSPQPMAARAVVIDEFAKGFASLTPIDNGGNDFQAVCGTNDGKNPICYAGTEAAAYEKGRAVARLIIGGSSLCTGWLLGDEGHLVTNNHCISTASQAANTSFDFMAEGTNCSSNCRSSGACGGTIAAASSQLIRTDDALDYTLVKLPGNPSSTYGYLQLRSSGAQLGEQVYLPEHSQGWGKHLQMEQAGEPLTVTSTTANGGSNCGSNQVTYSSDTQGGSSGSPVLSHDDNLVIALHHCGSVNGCNGLGVRIQDIVVDMGSDLPNNALGGSGGGGGGGGGGGSSPYCGDNSCNGAEDCSSCATDCGPCGGGGGGGSANPNSCQENNACGAQAPGGCWCDDKCTQFGDCCADAPCASGPVCGDGSCNGTESCDTCPSDCGECVNDNSCQQTSSCGGKAPGGCWCDAYCSSYGDCCADGPC